MKISKRQLKRIIREEKARLMLESIDTSNRDVRELLMNLLDAMQKSGVSPWYWEQMLNLMKKIGPQEALTVFEAAIIDLEKGTDPNVYA